MMKKKKLTFVIIAICIVSILIPINVSAWTTYHKVTTSKSQWYYFEGWFYARTLVDELTLFSSYHSDSSPHYRQIEKMRLFSVAEYAHSLPFTVSAGLVDIKRYDNGTLIWSISSFTYPSLILPTEFLNHSYRYGENFTNSYLLVEPGAIYKFIGNTGYWSDAAPFYSTLSVSKTYSY